MTENGAEKINRLTRELAQRDELIGRLEGRLCLVCGASKPCELDKSEMSPCTFDPSPIDAARAFLARAVAAERELRHAVAAERELGYILSKLQYETARADANGRSASKNFELLEVAERALTERTTERDGWMNQANALAEFLDRKQADLDKAIAEVKRVGDEAVTKLATAEGQIATLTNDKQALEAEIAELKIALGDVLKIVTSLDLGWDTFTTPAEIITALKALSTRTGAKVMADLRGMQGALYKMLLPENANKVPSEYLNAEERRALDNAIASHKALPDLDGGQT